MPTYYNGAYTGAEIDQGIGYALADHSSLDTLSSLQSFTGLTGGGAGELDGFVTVGVSVGAIARVNSGTAIYFYTLTAGTTAENSPYTIRPDDYDGTTNQKVWILQSLLPSSLGIGITPAVQFHVTIPNDATTNAVTEGERMDHNSTGTPAAGFGTRRRWRLGSSTTADQDAGAMDVMWRDATHATRSSGMAWAIVDQGGALTQAMFFQYATVSSLRYPCLGIGAQPLRPFHIKTTFTGGAVTQIALENDDTADNNGVVVSCRTTTTGTGGAAFQELAGMRAIFPTHDHPTRKGQFEFFIQNAGSINAFKFRPGNIIAIGDLSTQDISIARAAAKVWQLGDGDANTNGWLNYAGQKRVTSQFDKTDTTLATITGLSVALTAGRTYRFRAVLFITANATGGYKFSVDSASGSLTATAVRWHTKVIRNDTNAMVITAEKSALSDFNGNAGGTSLKAEIEGLITVNVAGSIAIKFAQNSASGTSSILVGSHLIVEDIP